MKYKINLHAHTIFSDGRNTPVKMAEKAKELDFSSLVLTDHFYGKDVDTWCCLNEDRFKLLRKASYEAKEILPVIIGIEMCMLNQEVLVFGGEAIQKFMELDHPSIDQVMEIKNSTYCALILCHPGGDFEEAAKVVDGFEQFNSGQNWFKSRGFGALSSLPKWCNSDAHNTETMDFGYNFTDSKITKEQDLIKYIKSGKQPEHYLKNFD